jgi:ribonuclease P/MRP protein subunit POP5
LAKTVKDLDDSKQEADGRETGSSEVSSLHEVCPDVCDEGSYALCGGRESVSERGLQARAASTRCMKHLPKHLRPRWRYLAVDVEATPDADLDRGTVQRHLWYGAQNLVGDIGSAAIDLQVLSFSFAEGRGEAIVRTRRGETGRARAVLASIGRIDGEGVRLRVRGISGTVRACEEKYMGRGPEPPEKRDVAFRGADRPAHVGEQRVDVVTDGGFAGATTLDI